MQPTEEKIERLALLTEECAEVQQIAMKIMRHGFESFNPFDEQKTPNRVLLEKELGHLMFAMHLMVVYYDLNINAIIESEQQKRSTIQEYLHCNIAVPPTKED